MIFLVVSDLFYI